MAQDDEPPYKYRIKSYDYTMNIERRSLLFTIEEPGLGGELRKFANEIVQEQSWQEEFSADDVAKILYAAEQDA